MIDPPAAASAADIPTSPHEAVAEARAEVRGVQTTLDAVERALGRLDDGSYFTCARCGRPLDAGALEADPLIEHCPQPCVVR